MADKIKFLISEYRVKFGLLTCVTEDVLQRDLRVFDQVTRVTERIEGEKRVRGLIMAYRFHNLIEDLAKPAIDDQLVLGLIKKRSKRAGARERKLSKFKLEEE